MTELGKLTSDFCKRFFGGLKPACEAAGLKYSTLHTQIAKEREIPFSSIQALCDAAGVSLEAFRSKRADIGVLAPQTSAALHKRAAAAYSQALRDVQEEMLRNGSDIMIDDVLNWLKRNNSRLEDFDVLRERVDLFRQVEQGDSIMRPKHIGKHSLAARFFNIEDTSTYLQTVSTFSRSIIDNSLAAHWHVRNSQRYLVEDVTIAVELNGQPVEGSYRRIMAPVQTPDGEQLTLVFARLLDYDSV
ncbi:hypothetical protein [Marimonas lutisalis]|uniref:hypothetical protein n=1 Tax=Marimonas lutisalis TaxID=2545756 RepID=UPI0010F9C5F4|nr:hypothetical protein [Marimonas lutisalis]